MHICWGSTGFRAARRKASGGRLHRSMKRSPWILTTPSLMRVSRMRTRCPSRTDTTSASTATERRGSHSRWLTEPSRWTRGWQRDTPAAGTSARSRTLRPAAWWRILNMRLHYNPTHQPPPPGRPAFSPRWARRLKHSPNPSARGTSIPSRPADGWGSRTGHSGWASTTWRFRNRQWRWLWSPNSCFPALSQPAHTS